MSINTEIMPWGTIIEMMPGKRHNFPNAKNYTAIYLGAVRGTGLSINVIRHGNSTVQKWHKGFWRQKTE